jgi:hypothetical protein
VLTNRDIVKDLELEPARRFVGAMTKDWDKPNLSSQFWAAFCHFRFAILGAARTFACDLAGQHFEK